MTRPPPVPPENQPQKARDLHQPKQGAPKETGKKSADPAARKGQQANIAQNTHHQGHQQDR